MRKWPAVPAASADESAHEPASAFVPPDAAAIQSDGRLSVASTVPESAVATVAGAAPVRILSTALVLMPLAPVGVWIGIRLVPHIPAKLFYRLVYIGMFLTGVKLLWDGFR